MGKCTTTIQEIRFITTDPQVSELYVSVTAEGDCPLGAQGWHHKTFPARLGLLDILAEGHFNDYLLWPLAAPKEGGDGT